MGGSNLTLNFYKMDVISKENLDLGIEMLSQLLDTKVDETNGDEVANLLNELTSGLGTSANLEACAKYYQVLNKKDADANATYLYIERINRNFTHRITALQTILRKEISSEFNQRRNT